MAENVLLAMPLNGGAALLPEPLQTLRAPLRPEPPQTPARRSGRAQADSFIRQTKQRKKCVLPSLWWPR